MCNGQAGGWHEANCAQQKREYLLMGERLQPATVAHEATQSLEIRCYIADFLRKRPSVPFQALKPPITNDCIDENPQLRRWMTFILVSKRVTL